MKDCKSCGEKTETVSVNDVDSCGECNSPRPDAVEPHPKEFGGSQ